jgi:predicted DNA-binding protein
VILSGHLQGTDSFRVYTVRLPSKTISRLRSFAKSRGLSPSYVARSFIEKLLDEHSRFPGSSIECEDQP